MLPGALAKAIDFERAAHSGKKNVQLTYIMSNTVVPSEIPNINDRSRKKWAQRLTVKTVPCDFFIAWAAPEMASNWSSASFGLRLHE